MIIRLMPSVTLKDEVLKYGSLDIFATWVLDPGHKRLCLIYNIFYRKEISKANHAKFHGLSLLLIDHEKRGNYQFADILTLQ